MSRNPDIYHSENFKVSIKVTHGYVKNQDISGISVLWAKKYHECQKIPHIFDERELN